MQVGRRRKHGEGGQRPIERFARQKQPTAYQNGQRGDFRQAAPQIVQNLPPRNHRQRIGHDLAEEIRHARQQPENNLPVTTHPAMLAPAERADFRGIVVHHLDVRYQTGAGVRTFDHVVAQDRVAREAMLQHLLEHADFVDTLAREAAFAEQILINVGDRARVNVEARIG